MLQPGYVDSDVTTEDESSDPDDDEVTCSLAEWRVNVGLTSRGGLEDKTITRSFPKPWPGLPPAQGPLGAVTGVLGQHRRAEVEKVQHEEAQNEQVRAKRSGAPRDAEQGQKRQRVERRTDRGGVAAALAEPPCSQAELAGSLEAAARVRSGGKKIAARTGPVVAVTLPEVALGDLPLGGPSSDRSSGGTSPFPTPMIRFFDQVMSERGGRLAGVEASGRDSQAGREGDSILQTKGEFAGGAQGGVAQDVSCKVSALKQKPAPGVEVADQGHANLHENREPVHGLVGGALVGEVVAQSEVHQMEGGQAGLSCRESLYSPGDDFWNEASAIAAALENQKGQGAPSKASSVGEGQKGHGAAAGGGLSLAAGPPDQRRPVAVSDRLWPGGAQDLEPGTENTGLPLLQLGGAEHALEQPNSQSPLPVRHLAFPTPEHSPDQASSLQPPLAGPVSLHSSQRAEREELPRPLKISEAAAAAAALLAPTRGLPNQLNHSLAKARTPFNSLATCALQTAPSQEFTFQSLAGGLHDTIEDSDSHAEDSISQFETQPESSPEDGGELHGIVEGGLVFGAVEMAQPVARAEREVEPLAQGPSYPTAEPGAIPLEASRFEEAFPGKSRLDVFPEHGAGPGPEFYERFPVGVVLDDRGVLDELPAGEAGFEAKDSPAVIGMLSPAPIGPSVGAVNRGESGASQAQTSFHGRPSQRFEGKAQLGLSEQKKDGSGHGRKDGVSSQAGRVGASPAMRTAHVTDTEARVKDPNSQIRKGGLEGRGAAEQVGPEEAGDGNTPPPVGGIEGAVSDLGTRPEEVVEHAANGVNTSQPFEDTEDPIECSLASQAEPSGQPNPLGKAPGAHQKKTGGAQHTTTRVGPFTPLSSPFTPRPAARKPSPEPGANQLLTGGPSREPVSTPAGPPSQQQGAHLHRDDGTPTQPLSLATPGGATGRVSEGGDSEPASCELRKYLPAEVCAVYASKGVARMYQWQVKGAFLEQSISTNCVLLCSRLSGDSFQRLAQPACIL